MNRSGSLQGVGMLSVIAFLCLVGVMEAGAVTLSPGDIPVADHDAAPGERGAVIKVDPLTGAKTVVSSGGFLLSSSGIASDANGQILVAAPASAGPQRIMRIDPLTGAQTTLSTGGFLVSPHGVAVAASGNIYVADPSAFPPGVQSALFRIDPATGAQTVLSSGGLFNDPAGLAIAANGDILVADFHAFGGPGGVIRVDPATGAQSIVSSGPIFGDPFAIAIVPPPPAISVAIDIKPGSFPNSINLGSAGTVPVAILSTTTFDARTVNPTTITLASAPVKLQGKGTPMAAFEDVNGDGLLDLVVHVTTETLQLIEADMVAVLEVQTFTGMAIWGRDSVRIVP